MFEDLTDEQVVLIAQSVPDGTGRNSDAMDYLISKYKNFVRARARNFFLVGADREDIVQEGMIGLFKAVRDYRPDRQASFRAFADLCVRCQIISAVKTATRQKHQPLNKSLSLDRSSYDRDGERPLIDKVPEQDVSSNPEAALQLLQDCQDVISRIGEQLSPIERDVLELYLEGRSYKEISEETGYHFKRVDNALQRVKNKLRVLLSKEAAD